MTYINFRLSIPKGKGIQETLRLLWNTVFAEKRTFNDGNNTMEEKLGRSMKIFYVSDFGTEVLGEYYETAESDLILALKKHVADFKLEKFTQTETLAEQHAD